MRGIIFDADGVIFLSTKVGMDSLIMAAEISGVVVPDSSQVRALWGYPLESVVIPKLACFLEWPSHKIPEIIHRFLDISQSNKYPEQPGLIDKLKSLSQQCKLGIISNRDKDSLLMRLEEQKINGNLFTHMQTTDSGIIKPDPRVFDHFWNGAGFKPESTIFIGDSIDFDLAAARNHQPKIDFVAITSGLHSRAEFIAADVQGRNIFHNINAALKANYLFV